jgi:hypothetical protein
MPMPYSDIVSIEINSLGHLFVSANEGVYRSIDNGDSWTFCSNGLPTTGGVKIAVNSSDHLFARSTFSGMFRSKNNGSSWMQINSGLTNIKISTLALNSSDYIFAGTLGSAVFRSIEPTTSIKEIGHQVNRTFILEQNYPNPFSQSTTIDFQLLNQSDVNLFIFDAFGQKVSTLIDENLKPGNYSVVWDGCGADGTRLSTGIYYYRFESNDNVETRQMIFLK